LKDKANELFKAGSYEQAYGHYKKGLEYVKGTWSTSEAEDRERMTLLKSQLSLNMMAVCNKTQNYKETVTIGNDVS
jgi:hypothetical protein